MKSSGKRFRDAPRGRGKLLAPRGGSYKHDPDFSRFLAQELGVESPPESFGKALRRVYAELPEDMPVRHYPLRSAMKSLATVAVLLVVFGISLLGANRVYPQLTEALPGLGFVFKTINGNTQEDPDLAQLPPAPTATPAPQPEPEAKEEAAARPAMPEFSPVQATSLDGSVGELTIENAWTDGKLLYVDIGLWAKKEPLAEEIAPVLEEIGAGEVIGEVPPQAIYFFRQEDVDFLQEVLPDVEFQIDPLNSFSIDGQPVGNAFTPEAKELPSHAYGANSTPLPLLYTGEEPRVGYTGGVYLHYAGTWAMEVPQTLYAGMKDTLSVKLDLPSARGYVDPAYLTSPYNKVILPLSFTAEFDVEIDKNAPVELQPTQPDNGVAIQQMYYTPVGLQAEITLPFLGYCGYSLLPDPKYFSTSMASTPYGLYAEVSDEDGSVLAAKANYEEPAMGPDGQLQVNLACEMDLPLGDREKLRLTFYQFPPNYLNSCTKFLSDITVEPQNQVIAEYTLDLAAGSAEPSEHYKEKGLSKLDAAQSPAMRHHPDLEDGVYVQGVDLNYPIYGGTQALVSLCVEPSRLQDIPHWALRVHSSDGGVMEVYACDVEGDAYYNEYDDVLGISCYNSGKGRFWRDEWGQGEYEQQEYIHLYFAVKNPDWWYMDTSSNLSLSIQQLDLVDTSTGEAIVPDLQAKFETNIEAVLRGDVYKRSSQPAGSALEEPSSQTVAPSPQPADAQAAESAPKSETETTFEGEESAQSPGNVQEEQAP